MIAMSRKIAFAVKSAFRTLISVISIGLVIMFIMPSVFGLMFITIGSIVSVLMWGLFAGLFKGAWVWMVISKIEKKAKGEK